MKKRKQWKTAPLPFQGQKRYFVKKFVEALKQYPSTATYVDLFGGSGLLSHTVKCVHPEARVIWNDYDNFNRRLDAIPQTNAILEKLRSLELETPRQKRITGKEREKVLQVLKKANEKGFVDWISLSGSLLFSMNYGQSFEYFEKNTMYQSIRKDNFKPADGYLDGIETMKYDYRQLFDKFKKEPNVVYLVDPPYLSTDSTSYKNYWTLKDHLKVLDVLDGQNYFYFTSNKSHIVELCEWVETRTSENPNPFKYATTTYKENRPTSTASFTDIMYHFKK